MASSDNWHTCIGSTCVHGTQPHQPVTGMSDQAVIAAGLDSAANIASGLGELGLANRLWALSAAVRRCAAAGHRYVRGADPCDREPAAGS